MTRTRWIVASIALLLFGALLVGYLSQPSTEKRLTKEELAQAASQPDAAVSYGYFFTPDERSWLKSAFEPYGCSVGTEPSRNEHACDANALFVLDKGNFIPCGYMYNGFSRDSKGTLLGVYMVKTVAWKPGKCEPTPKGTYPYPAGKLPVSSPGK